MDALPVGDGGAELVPLTLLLGDEVVEDVVAEDLAHELGGLELLDGLAKGARQALDALGGEFLLGLQEGVAGGLDRQRQLVLDALQARRDGHGKGQVRVGGRVGAAQLEAGGGVLAGLVRGDADERGAVLAAPRGVVGDLAGGDEALVGVHRGVRDQRELGSVLEDARDVVLPEVRKVRRMVVLGGPEEVLAVVVEQRLVQEHGAAGLAGDGLGHEGGVHALLGGELLDDQTGGHDVVRAAHGLGVAQLDAVLGRAGGVIGVLNRDGHLLEHERGLAAQVVGVVKRGEVEVARVVLGLELGLAIGVEVLDLGADVGDVALLVRLGEDLEQAGARVALEGLAVGRVHVAEDAGHGGLARAPRQHAEGIGVGEGEHVGFLEGDEAVDGGAVEADALLKRLLKLLGRDRERLEVAQNIGEPQTDEADIALLDGTQDEIDVLLAAHADSSSGSAKTHT